MPEARERDVAQAGTQLFPCFTSTKVQILTPFFFLQRFDSLKLLLQHVRAEAEEEGAEVGGGRRRVWCWRV
jgi:hypothetical protein